MIIEVQQVSKKFGGFVAVHDISFAVRKGEVVGFVGANGAGKTTTINMLLGFTTPTSGDVRLFGQTVRAASAHKLHARIGYAAGDMGLPPRITGAQYLQFVRRQSGGGHDALFDDLCQRFKPELHKKISALSRGNRQKIALIGAFVVKPELVILDEPTSGLDPIMQERFLELVKQEQARGATIFMSSHYLGEVADVCDRVILMRRGVVVRNISTGELLEQSGKHIRVTTGYKRTVPPRGAVNVQKSTIDGHLVLEFGWKSELGQLQQWIAGVKQLIDIEIAELDMDGVLKDMYDDEEAV